MRCGCGMVCCRKPQAASKPKLARLETELSAAIMHGYSRRKLAVASRAACRVLTTPCKKQLLELKAGEQQAMA